MAALTTEYFAQRWSTPTSPRLIKGRLIDETGCCCAQGDVLRCAGHSDQQLRLFAPESADREVARLLGITLAESVLLRLVNDEEDGCLQPQDVFRAPEKVLGPHYKLWTAFARHIEQMTPQDWERVAAAALAAEAAAETAAGAAAETVAWEAAWEAAWTAAEAAAETAAEAAAETAAETVAWAAAETVAWAAARAAARAAACHASDELIGWSMLEEPFFLKMFFPDPRAWVESVESIDED